MALAEDEAAGPPAAERPGSGSVGRVVRNSAINLASIALNAAFSLVAVFALARGLGRAGVGQYYTLFALMMLVQLVTETGLTTVLTARIALAPASWRETVAE